MKDQAKYNLGYQPRLHPSDYRRIKKAFRGRMIFCAWLLFLILVLIYILLFSPLFRIKEIKISGNRVVDSEEIKTLIFSSRSNIFLLTNSKLRDIVVGKFPRILSVQINKNIIEKTIDIKISERKEAGIFCKDRCYYIDGEGVIFEEAPETSGSLILVIKDYSEKSIELGTSVISKEFIVELISLRAYLSDQLFLKVLDFGIEDASNDLKINTNEGWYIILDRTRDFKSQLDALGLVLEEKIKEARKDLEYIDLRIENRVYYK